MRLSDLDADHLTPEQQEVYEALRNRAQGALPGLIGPFGVWVRAPKVGGAVQALGAAVRFGSSLAENVKEVAICTVGEFHRAKFEFAAHKRLARRAGVDEAALERMQRGEDPELEGDEAVAYSVASQLVKLHRIDPATYAAGVAAFGEEGLIELVTTIGYYCVVSLTLNAFEIPLPESWTDPFPEEA